ncbi:MAG: cadherin-like beta sandwich domain-containing protein [Clostridiales bacterium]|nr:cadherin-like beta sandwich domain-containing protein [Clostridiales bacterium]
MKRQNVMTYASIMISIMVFIAVIMVFISRVFAASAVTLELQTDSSPVEPGDTVMIEVSLDTFPNLTRFGPIEIQFDASSVSFSGLERGSDIPSTFSVNHSVSTGVIVVSGIDEIVEEAISSNQTAPTADEDGNPISPPEDPSMNRNEKTVLCRIYFEVLDSSKGELRFFFGNVAEFRDSSMETVTVQTGSPVSIPVSKMVSSDASLASLSIDGAALSPAFSPSVYEYTMSVPRSITDLVVSALPNSMSSQVFISGHNGLVVGENILTVTVLAQDLKTTAEYHITVTREQSFVPPGAELTDALGTTYQFADFPETLALPSGFYQSEITLEGRVVPAFRMNGMRDVLLYLTDPSGETGLYIYSPRSNSVLEFDAKNVFFRLSQLLTVVALPDGVDPPEGFRPTTVSFRGQSVSGFVSEGGRTTILYMRDDSGVSRFYTVDAKNNDLHPYVAQKQTESKTFFVLFLVFLILSIAEAAMLAMIIFQLRKRKPQTPKIRRV